MTRTKERPQTWRQWIEQNIFLKVILMVVIAVVLLSILIQYEVNVMEQGILEVAAGQQDNYVQLVLDEIHLHLENSDEEIITNILGVMDASTNRYWTFSKDEAMLFVKDVLETNKYKGFTTATYYVSDSARDFLNQLELDYVKHDFIEINDKKYVASGVTFLYDEEEYSLCLLTNESIYLENNHYMGAKLNLYILFTVLLFVSGVSYMLMARKIDELFMDREAQKEHVEDLNRSINELNARLNSKELYDTRRNIFTLDMVDEFLPKLQERNLDVITFVVIRCNTTKAREAFYTRAQVVLDSKVLRFLMDENNFLLLYLSSDYERVSKSVDLLIEQDVELVRMRTYEKEQGDLVSFYDTFAEASGLPRTTKKVVGHTMGSQEA